MAALFFSDHVMVHSQAFVLCTQWTDVKYATPICTEYVGKALSGTRAIFRVITIIMHILPQYNTLVFSPLWFGENVKKSSFVMLEIKSDSWGIEIGTVKCLCPTTHLN